MMDLILGSYDPDIFENRDAVLEYLAEVQRCGLSNDTWREVFIVEESLQCPKHKVEVFQVA